MYRNSRYLRACSSFSHIDAPCSQLPICIQVFLSLVSSPFFHQLQIVHVWRLSKRVLSRYWRVRSLPVFGLAVLGRPGFFGMPGRVWVVSFFMVGFLGIRHGDVNVLSLL